MKNSIIIEQDGKLYNSIRSEAGEDLLEDLSNLSISDVVNMEDFDQTILNISHIVFRKTASLSEIVITCVDENGFFIWSLVLENNIENMSVDYTYYDWTDQNKKLRYVE